MISVLVVNFHSFLSLAVSQYFCFMSYIVLDVMLFVISSLHLYCAFVLINCLFLLKIVYGTGSVLLLCIVSSN